MQRRNQAKDEGFERSLVKFTKMHALGNDFIVIDATTQPFPLDTARLTALSNRHTGIGFDQCLVVEKSDDPQFDFFYRIFNADGHEVGQCGNGARCLARFVRDKGLTSKTSLRVLTKTTDMALDFLPNDLVRMTLPPPCFDPVTIPMNVSAQQPSYAMLLSNGQTVKVHALSVGNPHAVCVVDEVERVDVSGLGKQISEHVLFSEQTNAGFMQIVDSSHIRLRVYERGCGETQACGSGAVAAAVVARLYYQVEPTVKVQLLGGELEVYWPEVNGPIYVTGPATFVYEGEVLG